jgi:hypothetical protein
MDDWIKLILTMSIERLAADSRQIGKKYAY